MSENAEHPLLLFIVEIHLCSAFSDYTAANKEHADDSNYCRVSKKELIALKWKLVALHSSNLTDGNRNSHWYKNIPNKCA